MQVPEPGAVLEPQHAGLVVVAGLLPGEERAQAAMQGQRSAEPSPVLALSPDAVWVAGAIQVAPPARAAL